MARFLRRFIYTVDVGGWHCWTYPKREGDCEEVDWHESGLSLPSLDLGNFSHNVYIKWAILYPRVLTESYARLLLFSSGDMRLRLSFLRRRPVDTSGRSSSVRPSGEEAKQWARSFIDLTQSKCECWVSSLLMSQSYSASIQRRHHSQQSF